MVLSSVNKILDWMTILVLYSIFIYGSTRFIIENLDEKEEDVRRITEPFTGIEFNIIAIMQFLSVNETKLPTGDLPYVSIIYIIDCTGSMTRSGLLQS